mgnify:CR=1 FL=1
MQKNINNICIDPVTGLLALKTKGRFKKIVPENFRSAILYKYHDMQAHAGSSKMNDMLADYTWHGTRLIFSQILKYFCALSYEAG